MGVFGIWTSNGECQVRILINELMFNQIEEVIGATSELSSYRCKKGSLKR